MVGRFDDQLLNAFLEIDGETEAALLLMPLGRPLPAGGSLDLREPRFEATMTGAVGTETRTYTSAIHAASSFRRAPGWVRPAAPVFGPGAASAGAPIALPPPARGAELFPVIRARRSVREYTDAPLSLAELAALLAAAQDAAGGDDPLLSRSAPLGLYVAVRDVTDLASGVYRYDPAGPSLVLLREGDLSADCRAATLNQDFCGTADAVFFKTARWRDLLAVDGDRGYRYACIRSGILGGALYLQATALGAGVCGVGAFTDPDVAAVVGVDSDVEAVLYVTAVGK